MRDVAERMRPPRVLYAEFPLGLPLGKPRDVAYQHRVLQAAFATLDWPSGPVLVDFPETIQSRDGEPLECTLPPRYDPNLHPAVDEAQALRAAYDRALAKTGRTSVGRVVNADQIPAAIEKFARIAEGEAWDQVGLAGTTMQVVHDIRAYYEELACEMMADELIPAWGAERWFYDHTEAGKVLLMARRRLKDSGADRPVWFFMAPGSRQ